VADSKEFQPFNEYKNKNYTFKFGNKIYKIQINMK